MVSAVTTTVLVERYWFVAGPVHQHHVSFNIKFTASTAVRSLVVNNCLLFVALLSLPVSLQIPPADLFKVTAGLTIAVEGLHWEPRKAGYALHVVARRDLPNGTYQP